MTHLYRAWTLFSLLIALSAHAGEPALVVVDPADRYATTYVALPKNFPAKKLEELKANLKNREGAYLEPWASFRADPARHVNAMIIRNDYPEIDIAKALTTLLERYDSTTFGITWNGGIAIMFGDFRYAERTYAAYLKDPASVKRPADRRADPIHPSNQMQSLIR